MNIAACADIHLDSKATAGGKIILGPDGRNIREADRERCLDAFVSGVEARRPHLIVIAGDLFDRPRPTPGEYVAACQALDRLCEVASVVLVGDNHGLPQSPLEAHAIAPLVGRLSQGGVGLRQYLHVCLRPEVRTISTQAGQIMVAGLPWPQRSLLAAKEDFVGLSPEALNALISDKLRGIVRGMLAQRKPNVPMILAGHVMLREAVFASGQGPDMGAITLSAEDVAGFDCAILGDIHGAQSFGGDERIFYCGSIDRCDFGEEHDPKGWWMVTLEGERFNKEMVETPARKFITWDPSDITDHGLLEQAIEEGRDISRCPVFRVKGQVSQEEYDVLAPMLAKWREIPTFSEALEVTRQTRARSEAMTADLGPETSLRLWHATNSRPEDLGELLLEHRRLAGV